MEKNKNTMWRDLSQSRAIQLLVLSIVLLLVATTSGILGYSVATIDAASRESTALRYSADRMTNPDVITAPPVYTRMPEITADPEQTIGWQEYLNPTNGLSLSYPGEFTAQDVLPISPKVLTSSPISLTFLAKTAGNGVAIGIDPNTDKLDISSYIAAFVQDLDAKCSSCLITDPVETEIVSNRAIIVETSDGVVGYYMQHPETKAIFWFGRVDTLLETEMILSTVNFY